MTWWEITILAVSVAGYGPMAFITSHVIAKEAKYIYDEDLPFVILAALCWPVALPITYAVVGIVKGSGKWMNYIRKVNHG